MRRRIGRDALACLLAALIAGGCTAPVEYTAQTYVVQPDDTLYSISWRHDLDFKELAAWNNLGLSPHLEPGQILTLRPPAAAAPSAGHAAVPAAGSERLPAVRAPPGTGRQEAPTARAAPRVGKARPLPDTRAETPAAASNPSMAAAALPSAGAWVWPTRVRAAPVPVAGGGILLLGALGQDVVAAAAGKVVYVGSGLRGYGNLVIIKHSDALLSAYAHNQPLGVREGQSVKAGERIGAMGLGPRQIPALYFEIRLNGKPVDVTPYLGKK